MSAITAQRKLILKHLDHGRSITSLEALDKFDCLRLAARIYDLREAGHNIITIIERNKHKRWARYTKL